MNPKELVAKYIENLKIRKKVQQDIQDEIKKYQYTHGPFTLRLVMNGEYPSWELLHDTYRVTYLNFEDLEYLQGLFKKMQYIEDFENLVNNE